MSFTSTATRKQVTITSSTLTSAIATGIHVFEDTNLFVQRTRAGVNTTLTKDTHYTVSGTLPGKATVTPVTGAVLADDILTIRSAIPIAQNSQYPNGARISETNLESDLDRAQALINQQQEILNRTLRVDDTATDAQIAGMEFSPVTTDGYVLTAGAGGIGVPGWSAAPSFGGAEKVYSNKAAMSAATGLTVGTRAAVLGEAEPFELVAGTNPEAGNAIQGVGIDSAVSGHYWKRQYDGGELMASWFGCVYDGTVSWNAGSSSFDVTGTDNGAAFEAALAHASSIKQNVKIEGLARCDRVLSSTGNAGITGNGPESMLIAGSGFPSTHTVGAYTFPAPQYYRQGSSGNAHIPIHRVRFHGANYAPVGVCVTGGANHALFACMAYHHTFANWVFDGMQNSQITNCRGDYAGYYNAYLVNGALNGTFTNFGLRHANIGQMKMSRDIRFYGSTFGTDANGDPSGYNQGSCAQNRFFGGVYEDTNAFQTVNGNTNKEFVLKIEGGQGNIWVGVEFVATPNAAPWGNGVTEAILVIRNIGGGNTGASYNRFQGIRFVGVKSHKPAIINDGFETDIYGCTFNNSGFWRGGSQIYSSSNINITNCAFSGRPSESFDAASDVNTAADTITITGHDFVSGGNEPVKYLEGDTAIGGADITNTFDAATAVTAATDRIAITAHGFLAGERLTYDADGGTVIPGLTDGDEYLCDVVDDDTIRLLDVVSGAAIDITDVGSGTQKLTLSTGLLDQSEYYVKYVDANTIQLSLALGGAAIRFSTGGTGTAFIQTLTTRIAHISQSEVTFDATAISTANDTIPMVAHGFTSGQLCTYDADGGTPVGGLTDGTSTYVISVVDADDIKLLSRVDASAIDLTSTGTGTQKITSNGANYEQLNFTPTSADRAGIDTTQDDGGDLYKAYYQRFNNTSKQPEWYDAASNVWKTADDQFSGTKTYTDGDTTPSVRGNRSMAIANTVATSITNFDDGKGGQLLELTFDDANTTLVDAATLRLANSCNWNPASGDSIILRKQRVSPFMWVEESRMPGAMPPSGLQVSKTVLSAAQVNALFTTPISLVSAPGTGRTVAVEKIVIFLNYGGTAYVSANDVQFRYTNASGAQVAYSFQASRLTSTADEMVKSSVLERTIMTENAPVVAVVPSANPTTGNSPITVWAFYYIFDSE